MTGTPFVGRPLEGIRVIDFCVIWAGPYSTMLLGDLGAEVVKLESTRRMQPSTRGRSPRPDPEFLARLQPWVGGYPDGGHLDRPWNASPVTLTLFRNKRSVTMELKTQTGREAFERLVRCSDVFYENNAPETVGKFGISYEYLKSLNPGIIMVRAPAFSIDGPAAGYRAAGMHSDALTGHSLLRKYPDEDLSSNTDVYPADFLSGAHGAFAVIAALEERRKTGQGQLVEHTLVETAAPQLAEFHMDYAINGRVSSARGNRDIHGACPAGVFKAIGDDRWIALSVRDDRDWLAFCGAMKKPDWAADARFATREGRLANEDELEALLSAAIRTHGSAALAAKLQEAGVPAAPVMDARDILEDEHAKARGDFLRIEHPDAGHARWVRPPWHFDPAPVTVDRPPVQLGQDNEYVYREILGFSEAEYAALVASGDVGDEYHPDAR